jgi:hypothetical protein
MSANGSEVQACEVQLTRGLSEVQAQQNALPAKMVKAILHDVFGRSDESMLIETRGKFNNSTFFSKATLT